MPASVSMRRYASRICVSTRPGAHAGWNGSGSGTSTWRVRICVMRMDLLRKGAGGTASPGPRGLFGRIPDIRERLDGERDGVLVGRPLRRAREHVRDDEGLVGLLRPGVRAGRIGRQVRVGHIVELGTQLRIGGIGRVGIEL